VENKKEQIEYVLDQKFENTRIQCSDLASHLAGYDNNLTMAVDNQIENRMNEHYGTGIAHNPIFIYDDAIWWWKIFNGSYSGHNISV